MPTVTVQFGIKERHLLQAKRHLARAGIVPVVAGSEFRGAFQCNVYTSEPDRVIDVLLKSGFKSLLVPNRDGAIIIEDWARAVPVSRN